MVKLLIILFSSLFALEIEIGKETLEVEIANTSEKRKKGLGGRENLPEGTGMLFVFEQPQICHFWMKDTLIPLSIGFFCAERKLVDIKEMEIPHSKSSQLTLYSSPSPVLYALEVPKGWFHAHNIKKGIGFNIKKNIGAPFLKNSSSDTSNLLE